MTPRTRRTRPPYSAGVVVLAVILVLALWAGMGWAISVIADNARDGVSVWDGITIAIAVYLLTRQYRPKD